MIKGMGDVFTEIKKKRKRTWRALSCSWGPWARAQSAHMVDLALVITVRACMLLCIRVKASTCLKVFDSVLCHLSVTLLDYTLYSPNLPVSPLSVSFLLSLTLSRLYWSKVSLTRSQTSSPCYTVQYIHLIWSSFLTSHNKNGYLKLFINTPNLKWN